MLASVVIPARNAEKTLRYCLEAALNQSISKPYEVIVVDDGSTDKTPQIAAEYPVRLLQQPKLGPAAARNLGARCAKGRILVFLDSDCIPKKNWLHSLLSLFREENVAGVGGPYETANPESWLARLIGYELALKHANMPRYVDYLGGFNCAYRREIFERIGGFDESFTEASGEDNDLSYRVVEAGYKLAFCHEAIVAHYHPTSLKSYLKKQFKRAYWRIKLYKKHPRKIGGDVYARMFSPIAQVALCGITIITFAVGPLINLICWLFTLALALALIMFHLPFTVRAYKRFKDKTVLLAPFVFAMRGFSWTLGFVVGILKFGLPRLGRLKS